jgi:ribulose-phosphate 3-epimerase
MLTVHPSACADVVATLSRIEALGVQPAVAINIDEPLETVWALLERVDRMLLMSTALGVKGVEIEPAIYERIRAVVRARERCARRPDVFVDGGIRRHTAPLIALAGSDGVTPGSLVFGEPDPVAAVRWIGALPAESA